MIFKNLGSINNCVHRSLFSINVNNFVYLPKIKFLGKRVENKVKDENLGNN